MSARATRGSYPHPVLDTSDDVSSTFEVSNAEVTPGVDDVRIRFDMRSDDPTLQRLLAERKARISLRWRCSATLASEEFEPSVHAALADGHQFECWIDQRQVRGEIKADVRVLAVEPLRCFRWERQHSVYGDAVFDLRVGDVLADGGTITFRADKLYDPLDPPVGSCFKFMLDTGVRKGFKVTFGDEEAVTVRLSPGLHRSLGLLAARPELQISAIVLPTLMETITFIQKNRADPSGEDLADFSWCQVISNLVERIGSFDDSAVDLAQAILSYPVDLTLSQIADADEEDE